MSDGWKKLKKQIKKEHGQPTSLVTMSDEWENILARARREKAEIDRQKRLRESRASAASPVSAASPAGENKVDASEKKVDAAASAADEGVVDKFTLALKKGRPRFKKKNNKKNTRKNNGGGKKRKRKRKTKRKRKKKTKKNRKYNKCVKFFTKRHRVTKKKALNMCKVLFG